jgi:hypothetical protein
MCFLSVEVMHQWCSVDRGKECVLYAMKYSRYCTIAWVFRQVDFRKG